MEIELTGIGPERFREPDVSPAASVCTVESGGETFVVTDSGGVLLAESLPVPDAVVVPAVPK